MEFRRRGSHRFADALNAAWAVPLKWLILHRVPVTSIHGFEKLAPQPKPVLRRPGPAVTLPNSRVFEFLSPRPANMARGAVVPRNPAHALPLLRLVFCGLIC